MNTNNRLNDSEADEHGKSVLLMLGCFLIILVAISEAAEYYHWLS